MPYSFFDPMGLETDEEKKKGQQSETKIETKPDTSFKFFSPNTLTEFEKSRPKESVVTPVAEPKKNILQKAGDFVSGIFKKKDQPTEIDSQISQLLNEGQKNYINNKKQPSVNSGATSTFDNILLKNLEDKYIKLNKERESGAPRTKQLAELEKSIIEIEDALNASPIEKNSIGKKIMVADKYSRERNIENIKGAAVGVVKNTLDGIASLFEVEAQKEQDFANKQEGTINQALDNAGITDPAERQKYIEKYSPRYQTQPLKPMEGTLAEREKKAKEAAEAGRVPFQKVMEKYIEDVSPSNPDFGDAIVSGIGSMGAFFIASAVTGGGAIAPTILESLGEAGAVYEENKKKGMKPVDAFKDSSKNFVGNLIWNALLNKASGLFENVGQPIDMKLKEKILSTIRASSFEGIQEGGQQIMSNMTTGKENVWEGVPESVGVGAIIGGGAMGVEVSTGANVSPTTEVTGEDLQAGGEQKKPVEEAVKNVQKYIQTPAASLTEETVNTLRQEQVGVEELPFNDDGTITLYRKGDVRAGQPNSYSLVQSEGQQAYTLNKDEVILNTNSEKLVDLYKQTFDPELAEVFTEALKKFNVLESEVIAVPSEVRASTPKAEAKPTTETKAEKVQLYRGEKGTVSESTKTFEKVLSVKGYQPQLLEILAKQGNTDAQAVLDNRTGKKIDFVSADKVIREAFKDQYNAISYDNSTDGRSEIGTEYFDLSDGKFYAVKEETASVYAKQTREGKYKPAQKEEKVSESKKEVSKPELIKSKESELKAVLQENIEPVEQAMAQIFMELEVAEAGQRIFTENGVIGIKSSFPKWIPEDLRSKDLFNKVLKDLSIENLQYPTGNKPRQRALYDAIFDAVDSLAGIDTSSIRADIIKAYATEVSKTKEVKKSKETKGRGASKPQKKADRSTKRSTELKAPSGFATTGTYDSQTDSAEVPNGIVEINNLSKEEAETELKGISAIKFPELVRIAKELTKDTPTLNSRFKSKLGVAKLGKNQFSAKIELNPEIFKDEELMGKVLAHEIGHVADYLPEGNIKRGNLIARIHSLNKYLKQEFGELNNKTIRNELISLTTKWNPFDPQANKAYTQYRYSPAELYAEAISVMFNQPSFLKSEAPTFWDAFFTHIDAKPEVKETFFGIWELLNKGEEAVGSERDKSLREMFTKGEALYRAKIMEKQKEQTDVKAFLRNTFIDKNSEAIRKINQARKENKYIPDDKNPEYYLEGINYLNGYVSEFLEKNYQPMWEKLQKAGVSWEQDFGQILFLERVANERSAAASPAQHLKSVLGEGAWNEYAKDLPKDIDTLSASKQLAVMEKVFGGFTVDGTTGETLWDEFSSLLPKGIANPQGYNQTTAKEQLAFLKKQMGDEKWNVLQETLEAFRGVNQKVLQLAEKEGFYRKELLEEMKANPNYATFQVLDYLDTHIPASIKRQVGTLKDIASPSTSTVMKNISILKAIERNKATRSLVEFMQKNFPTEVEDAKTMFNGRYQVPIDPKNPKMKLVTYMKDGQFTGVYMDAYIAEATNYWSTPQMATAGKILRVLSGNKFYRPLFITFNLGFQSFNLMRDATRFYKNTPTIKWWQVWKVPQLYIKAAPASLRRGWDLSDQTISEMKESKILSITYNDVIKGEIEEDTQFERIMQKFDVMKPEEKKNLFRPVIKLLDTIERTGNFIETLPKVAGYLELQGKLPSNELASFIRKSIGSPDFMRRGTAYPIYNELFLFSNAIKEGWRSDLEIATKPSTRGGYWVKTAVVNITPKLLMMAALYGLLGDKIKKLFENVSEYDMSNYIVIPLGMDENGKTAYIRIPMDETGRFFSALMYKGMTAAINEQSLGQDLADIFSFTGGQLPTVNPTLTTLGAIKQYLSGQNPYDYFRGRNVIPDAEFEAGGKYAFKPFAMWVANNLGLGIVFKSVTSVQAEDTKTWLQKTIEAPVLSNIIGRWVKVSDYGQTERNRQVVKDVKQTQAVERLEKNNLIGEAVKQYREGEPSYQRRSVYERKLINDVFGNPPYDSTTKAQITNTLKKFRISIVKGEADPKINSLISATTNEEKYALLSEIYDTMDKGEFAKLRDTLLQEKIVSGEVFRKLYQEKK